MAEQTQEAKFHEEIQNMEYEPHAYCPLASIVTLPATGTEMNCGGVVSCRRLHENTGVSHPTCYPVFSILAPDFELIYQHLNKCKIVWSIPCNLCKYFLEKVINSIVSPLCASIHFHQYPQGFCV